MTSHSSITAWEIPWTEEPGELQSMGLQRVRHDLPNKHTHTHFPDSSAGKESTCNAGDPSSIPVLGRFPGEVIGYPLQYSLASLVAQMVKNLPTMGETWV